MSRLGTPCSANCRRRSLRDAGTSPSLRIPDATGTIVYDPKTGLVKSSETNMTLNGTLSIEIGQQTTSVELTQTQKTTVTTSDKDPTKK